MEIPTRIAIIQSKNSFVILNGIIKEMTTTIKQCPISISLLPKELKIKCILTDNYSLEKLLGKSAKIKIEYEGEISIMDVTITGILKEAFTPVIIMKGALV